MDIHRSFGKKIGFGYDPHQMLSFNHRNAMDLIGVQKFGNLRYPILAQGGDDAFGHDIFYLHIFSIL
jgi:hypothetical protein